MQPMTVTTPPIAAKKPNSITHHGIAVTDDYAWLRDPGYPEVSDEQVLAHLDRVHARCGSHVLVHEFVHACRGLVDRQSELVGDSAEGGAIGSEVEWHLSTEEELRIEHA